MSTSLNITGLKVKAGSTLFVQVTNGASINLSNAVVNGEVSVSANNPESDIDISNSKIEGNLNIGNEVPDLAKYLLD